MPLHHKVGNLLDAPEINVILHQANLFHTFGAGIAKAIKEKFPEAYVADCATPHGDSEKLGTYSHARSNGKLVLNCYSQTGMGAKDRNTSYNDIYTIFQTVEQKARAWNDKNGADSYRLGVPYKFGCGLAGGSWRVVLAIFEDIFKNSPVSLTIVRLESEPEIEL